MKNFAVSAGPVPCARQRSSRPSVPSAARRLPRSSHAPSVLQRLRDDAVPGRSRRVLLQQTQTDAHDIWSVSLHHDCCIASGKRHLLSMRNTYREGKNYHQQSQRRSAIKRSCRERIRSVGPIGANNIHRVCFPVSLSSRFLCLVTARDEPSYLQGAECSLTHCFPSTFERQVAVRYVHVDDPSRFLDR